ncbi:MAG: hypothetical protein RSB41_03570 [Bacilli bacterium]
MNPGSTITGLSSLTKTFNLSKILGTLNKGLGIANQMIPIYKQVKPIAANIRKAASMYTAVKHETEKEAIEEANKNIRPIEKRSPNKQNTELIRGNNISDTLTFFQ